MTREELSAIFQDVNQQLKSEDFVKTLLENFRKDCAPDPNGKVSTEHLIPAAIAAANTYSRKFLFEVLSRALCKD